jgi:hypothetical protein
LGNVNYTISSNFLNKFHIPQFSGSTSQQHIHNAVKFIDRIANEGKTCYVHCKVRRNHIYCNIAKNSFSFLGRQDAECHRGSLLFNVQVWHCTGGGVSHHFAG